MSERRFFGQPIGLGYLAFTEAWERFSFYGMGALVVLYMTQTLLLPGHVEHVAGFAALRTVIQSVTGPLSIQATASIIYGLYSGLVYFTPLVGGLIADRLLGARATVVIGAVLMSAGHIAMAFDVSFLLALLLLIVGCGCLKGNISAQVGSLYNREDDGGRTRGFAIFSVGINVGAVTGPLLCGLLAQIWGWHAGFAAAGVLMVAGLITYLAGLKHLPAPPPRQERNVEARTLTAAERRTVALLVGVITITIFQSLAYYQITDVGMVWIAQKVDLATPLGPIPVPWFNSVDSFSSIVSVAPLFALWRWQDRHGGEPGDLGKIGIGAAICAASALVLAAASAVAGEGRINALWPLVGFFGMGVAFIYYWPTLLALVSRRAPTGLTGTMLGVTFLSLFVSNTIMGWVGSFYERLGPTAFWCLDAAIACVGMLLVAALRLPLGSGLRLVNAPDPAG
ncbi:MAG TPA: peptide MFS transporter [Caulobacteraceae bacterium]|jgi:POT family proton-dependent oligopeptide transporter|nr:peptide MFS transporter [Caulobacteraceae bacterium]